LDKVVLEGLSRDDPGTRPEDSHAIQEVRAVLVRKQQVQRLSSRKGLDIFKE
jgi:hypothetical protein